MSKIKKIIDEGETQNQNKTKKEQGAAEAIAKGWEINDFVKVLRGLIKQKDF